MPEPKPSQSPMSVVGGIVGAIGGWTFSQYCGSSVWIPGIAALLLLLLFTKTAFKPRYFIGAIAATGGHLVWFLVGTLITSQWSATGLDIIVLTAGIIWLWLRPGLGSALFLGIIQVLSLIVNVVSLWGLEVGSFGHRALTAHIVFRTIALVCLGTGYWRMKKDLNAKEHSSKIGQGPVT